MEKAIIGRKVGMTQLFAEDGKVIPVTVIEAGPCTVVQIKPSKVEGCNSVQLGFGETKEHRLSKGEKGHLAKAGAGFLKHLKEFILLGEFNPGDTIDVSVFSEGDSIDVTGVSKGKGYQGVIKRHGFGRGRMTHGGGPTHRHAGSMGANSDPSRVFPGKKMAGHMGSEQVTICNLKVAKVDAERNVIAVRGAVPGANGSLVYLRDTNKKA